MSLVQRLLDKSTVHPYARWGGFVALYALFWMRIIATWNSYPAILYISSINLLFTFVGFITPAVDMESEHAVDILPTRDNDRPFPRAVAEFKAWKRVMGTTAGCLFATFVPGVEYIPCDVPLLIAYFVGISIFMLAGRIRHMRKYNYSPFQFGKTSSATPAKGGDSAKEYAKKQ